MSDLITTLHPQDDNSVNLYPNIKLENIIDGTAEDAGKFVKVNEEGKFIVDTVNIPEPQQVNNSTVTIKQGGVDKGSFTLNQAEDATIELDAGSAGESGSSMYATSSAISKGVPAHIEAANPIRVGDTISQFYFNTQQDIKSYLETCVDWGNGKKVQYVEGLCTYTLLSALSDENSLGFRSLKSGDYIKYLKIKSDFNPGDSKIDSDLNNWLATILSSNSSVTLLQIVDIDIRTIYEALRAYTSGSGIYEIQLQTGHESGWNTIYSSTSGYMYTYWRSDEHAYDLTYASRELQIETINESSSWNGVFFGAVSAIGEPLLTAFLYPENPEYYVAENIYFLAKSMFAIDESDVDAIYYSSDSLPFDTRVTAGWYVAADQPITLDSPEKAKVVNDAVSKIAATENNWVNISEVFGNIYQDDILGTDEVKVDDILVDTAGTLGKVKELSEELVKNQHPANPFAVGDEIPANSYVYIDTSITPDLSKIDWSSFVSDGSSSPCLLAPLESFASMEFTQSMALDSLGIKLNKPIYALVIGENICSYYQVDPSDIDKVLNSSLSEYLATGVNEWHFSEQVTHEGSIFKVPLGNAEAVTLTDVSDQDVWGAYISKDGKWVEDTPILRTKVSCEALRQLPTDYENLDGIPIIKSEYVLTGTDSYQFIPSNYLNKYIQDPTGIIYFCDGQKLYQLRGDNSDSKFTVNIDALYGLNLYGTDISDTGYSAKIGLTDAQLNAAEGDYAVFSSSENNYGWVTPPARQIIANNGITASREVINVSDVTTIGLETGSLGDYSQASGDQVFGKRGNSFGWVSVPSQSGTQIQAGNGISVNGNTVSLTSDYINKGINSASTDMYVMARGGSSMSDLIGWGSVFIPHGIKAGTGLTSTTFNTTTDEISLSQDVQDKLAKIPDTAIETYSEGTGIALTQTGGNDKQISLSQDYITKLKPIMDAQDDLITDLVHKTTDNETAILAKYTKPAIGIPASDLASDVQDSLTKANSALQESALSGYATTNQVNAKYTKPTAGIPETDLSADVQSALTKANSAITSLPTNTVTTDTEQTLTGKKAFNGGLSSSTIGSNSIQTTVDFGAGSNVKVEQEKSGAKVGIQYSISENQLSIYAVTGSKESRLDFNGDGVKYGASELATKADLNAKIANSNFIVSADYDNTTLKAHIDEILTYVNSENGGTLVSVGFKVGTTGASTTITNLHMSSDNTISIDTETDVILGAGSYYYAYPEQVVTSGANEGVFFTCRNGFTLGHGILYITDAGTKEAKLTGESTVITSATQITKMMFQDVDISEVNLEHLTINFYKFNQAE